MKKILKAFFIIAYIALLFMESCIKWEDEPLTIKKKPYEGLELRTDGYYYNMEDDKIWYTYFFYRNGVLLYGAGTDTLDDNLDKYDEWFVSEAFLEYIKTNKRRWGLFEIHDDSIVFERWVMAEGGFPVLRFSGNIIDDTTFIITRSEYPHQGDVYNKNEVFHFRSLSPKPDSTNTFIP